MIRKVPPSLYSPALPYQIEAQLRRGEMPSAFVRRMRVINCLSAITLMKFEESLMSPFDVIDLHHILDRQISQDAILDQMDSDEMSYACLTGNVSLLLDIAPANPLLQKGYSAGWVHQFLSNPFDPLCVMLAMRAKALLDLVDQEGHSYNLIRKLGFGFIDFGDIPGEEPGDPGDYYPPEINNPIIIPEVPVPPEPEPEIPTPPEPGPGEPGYVPPAPGPGEPGYVPPAPGEPEYVPPEPEPEIPTPPEPEPGEPGYVPPAPWPGEITSPAYGPFNPYNLFPGRSCPVAANASPDVWNCCKGTEEDEDYVTIGYEKLLMSAGTTQMLTVEGSMDICEDDNYTWEITSGTGELLTNEGKTTFYTAPETNPDCVYNPTIALICKESIVDSIYVVIDACAPDVKIGYTTQGMQVNEVQELTAIPTGKPCGDPIYTWEIVSGGGSLDKVAGTTVTYTAPSTNPNCDANATIALSCNFELKDNLLISVNEWEGERYACLMAERICEAKVPHGSTMLDGSLCDCEGPGFCWSCFGQFYACDGSYHLQSLAGMCWGESPDWCEDHCQDGVFDDWRNQEQKDGGCCPPCLEW